jgi:hypothetical protein
LASNVAKAGESLSKPEEENFYAAPWLKAPERTLAIGSGMQRDFRLTATTRTDPQRSRWRKAIYQAAPIMDHRFGDGRVIPNIRRFGKSQ